MKPGPFVHHAPRTVDEAVAVLGEVGHDGKVLAGGQSLIPVLNMRLANPGPPRRHQRRRRAGCRRRHRRLGPGRRARPARGARAPRGRLCRPPAAAPGPAQRRPPGDPQPGHHRRLDRPRRPRRVRCRRSLVLTDGVVEAVGPAGRREIAAADFFEGPLETTLAHDELVEAVRFGTFAAGDAHGLRRVSPPPRRLRAGRRGGRGRGRRRRRPLGPGRVRVGDPGADRPRPHRRVLGGRDATAAVPDEVVDAVRAHVDPEGDIHASADYRRMLAAELTRRALAARHPRRRGGSGVSGPTSPQPEQLLDIGIRVNGVRAVGAGPGPPPAVRLPAPRPRAHGHPRRLRARRVRRVHRARRRRPDALLPDVRGVGPGSTRSRRSRGSATTPSG